MKKLSIKSWLKQRGLWGLPKLCGATLVAGILAAGIAATPVVGQTIKDIDTSNTTELINGDDVMLQNDITLNFFGDASQLFSLNRVYTENAGTGSIKFSLAQRTDPLFTEAQFGIANAGESNKRLAKFEIDGGDIFVGELNADNLVLNNNGFLLTGNNILTVSSVGSITGTSGTTLYVVGGTINFTDVSTQNTTVENSIGNLMVAGRSVVNFAGSLNGAYEGKVKIEGITLNDYSKVSFGEGVNPIIETMIRTSDNEAVTNTYESAGSVIELHSGSIIDSNGEVVATGFLTVGSDIIEKYSNGNEVIHRFDGNIIDNGSLSSPTLISVVKEGKNSWSLGGTSQYFGNTEIREGLLEARSYRALGNGAVVLYKDATLRIGDENARTYNNLIISNDWSSDNGNLQIVVGSTGHVGSLIITGSVTGTTNVEIIGTPEDMNKWGGRLLEMPNGHASLVLNFVPIGAQEPDPNAFVLVGKGVENNLRDRNSNEVFTGFETSRYGFRYEPGVDEEGLKVWNIASHPQDVVVPDLSTMVLTNIIGFEIPRAQNVNGPWVRMRGGEIKDDKANFDKTTYQSLQVGWDKTFNADRGGSWNTGIFFEGDWSYGRGNWHSMWGTINGNLKSKASGAGAGLYVSRGFKSGWYFDTIGRLSVFENEVNMNTYGNNASKDNDYEAGWSNSIFNLAFEIGKDFESRDGRWTFNPYNRVIYTNAPGKKFNVTFGDNSIVNVSNRAVDAWTNKLGARLAYNLDFCNRHKEAKSIVFVGADWYKGLSGRFITDMYDTLNPAAEWKSVKTNRPKNDLDYGTATIGLTYLPASNFAVTAQTDILFGDVEGYAVGLSGRLSF